MIDLYLIEGEDDTDGWFVKSPAVPDVGERIEDAERSWLVKSRS